jgi:hypothetical protein
LFSEKTFGEYLLVDPKTTKLTSFGEFRYSRWYNVRFCRFIEILSKEEWKNLKARRWKLLFRNF